MTPPPRRWARRSRPAWRRSRRWSAAWSVGSLGVSDVLVGLAEDALALKLGGEAVGMSYNQIGAAAREAVEELTEQAGPYVENARERLLPSR